MQTWLAHYGHYNTILMADNREDARKQAVSAFGLSEDKKNRIIVVPRTLDGRIG